MGWPRGGFVWNLLTNSVTPLFLLAPPTVSKRLKCKSLITFFKRCVSGLTVFPVRARDRAWHQPGSLVYLMQFWQNHKNGQKYLFLYKGGIFLHLNHLGKPYFLLANLLSCHITDILIAKLLLILPDLKGWPCTAFVQSLTNNVRPQSSRYGIN